MEESEQKFRSPHWYRIESPRNLSAVETSRLPWHVVNAAFFYRPVDVLESQLSENLRFGMALRRTMRDHALLIVRNHHS